MIENQLPPNSIKFDLPSFSVLLLTRTWFRRIAERTRGVLSFALNGFDLLRILISVYHSHPSALGSLGPSWFLKLFFGITASTPVEKF